MMGVDTDLQKRCRNLFIAVCEELAKKVPEQETLFRAMIREAKEYSNFPIATNLGDIVASYYDTLDDATIKKFVMLRAL